MSHIHNREPKFLDKKDVDRVYRYHGKKKITATLVDKLLKAVENLKYKRIEFLENIVSHMNNDVLISRRKHGKNSYVKLDRIIYIKDFFDDIREIYGIVIDVNELLHNFSHYDIFHKKYPDVKLFPENEQLEVSQKDDENDDSKMFIDPYLEFHLKPEKLYNYLPVRAAFAANPFDFDEEDSIYSFYDPKIPDDPNERKEKAKIDKENLDEDKSIYRQKFHSHQRRFFLNVTTWEHPFAQEKYPYTMYRCMDRRWMKNNKLPEDDKEEMDKLMKSGKIYWCKLNKLGVKMVYQNKGIFNFLLEHDPILSQCETVRLNLDWLNYTDKETGNYTIDPNDFIQSSSGSIEILINLVIYETKIENIFNVRHARQKAREPAQLAEERFLEPAEPVEETSSETAQPVERTWNQYIQQGVQNFKESVNKGMRGLPRNVGGKRKTNRLKNKRRTIKSKRTKSHR